MSLDLSRNENLKRKVIQQFANTCCQMFLTSTSNMDMVNIVIFGSGTITIDFINNKSTHNNHGILPMHYYFTYRKWLEDQCINNHVNISELTKVELVINVDVTQIRKKDSLGWLSAQFKYTCSCCIETDEKQYESNMSDGKIMGLGQILYDHVY